MYCVDPSAPQTTGASSSDKEWTVDEGAAVSNATDDDDSAASPGLASEVASQPQIAVDTATPPKRLVSGLYKGAHGDFQLDLRVDVDGKRPTRCISGDLYRVAGSTTTYFGSFIVSSPTLTVTSNKVTIKGSGNYSFTTLFPIVT